MKRLQHQKKYLMITPLCFRPENQSFCREKQSDTRSQFLNSADSLAQNTPNASKCFNPICQPKPKTLRFLKKNLSGCP